MSFYHVPETTARTKAIQRLLEKNQLDAALIYYDMVNIANGWYLTGWCPQFEYGALLVPIHGEPLLLVTKSGGFGDADALLRALCFLQPQPVR